MKKRVAIVLVLAVFLPFQSVEAQERGFYLVSGASFGFNNQTGLKSNEVDKIQYYKLSEEHQSSYGYTLFNAPYEKKWNYDLSLGAGYMFADKGNGPRCAIEIGVEYRSEHTQYKDSEDYNDYTNYWSSSFMHVYPGTDTRILTMGAHASFIRRMNLGGGMILEPQFSAGIMGLSPQEYRGLNQSRGYRRTYDTRIFYASLTPFALEHRFEQNRHLGLRLELGTLSYMYCNPSMVIESFQVFSFDINQFSISLSYYF